MRVPQYRDGQRNGIKACVQWLHDRAAQMSDPRAQQILNSAAFDLGWDMKARAHNARTDGGESGT